MNNGVIYTAGKAGVLGHDNIRVNAVLPGPVHTPQMKAKLSAEKLAAVPRTLPLGRWVQPEEGRRRSCSSARRWPVPAPTSSSTAACTWAPPARATNTTSHATFRAWPARSDPFFPGIPISQKLIELAGVFQTPLKLDAMAGDTVLIMTDTQMDPLVWQGLATAANCLGTEPVVTVMTARAHHAANPASPARIAALDPEVDLVVYLTSTAVTDLGSDAHHVHRNPPSTGSNAPVMNDARDEARNKQASATSSGSAGRARGTRAR